MAGEVKRVLTIQCPECGGTEFQLGPRGGAAQNIRCRCGHRLNVTKLFDGSWWVEDIDEKKLLKEATK